MHQPGRVGGVQRTGYLPGDRHRARRFQHTLLAQQVPQAAALDELHVEEKLPIDLAGVVHRNDVRLPQLGHQPGFVPKTLPKTGVPGEPPAQQLECDHPIVNRVVGPVDLAGVARAEQ